MWSQMCADQKQPVREGDSANHSQAFHMLRSSPLWLPRSRLPSSLHWFTSSRLYSLTSPPPSLLSLLLPASFLGFFHPLSLSFWSHFLSFPLLSLRSSLPTLKVSQEVFRKSRLFLKLVSVQFEDFKPAVYCQRAKHFAAFYRSPFTHSCKTVTLRKWRAGRLKKEKS